MSDETAALTATLKAGGGYDAPWLVVRASTTAEMNQYLEAVGQHGVLAKVAATAVELAGIYNASAGLGATPVQVQVPQGVPVQAGPTSPAPASAPAPSQSAPQAQAAPGPTCQHGAMKFREGVGKTSGKPYKAWFCPQPQGAPQCDPHFIR